MTLLGYYPTGDGHAVERVRLEGGALEVVVGLLQDHPWVEEARIIEEGPGYVEVDLILPVCGLDHAIRRSQALPEFPIPIRAGKEHLRLRADKGTVAQFLQGYSAVGQEARLKGIGKVDTTVGLTDRQREVLEAAVAAGYYHYPRRTSLTELARQQGISKSTLCELLMTIEGKVMRELASETTGDAPPIATGAP